MAAVITAYEIIALLAFIAYGSIALLRGGYKDCKQSLSKYADSGEIHIFLIAVLIAVGFTELIILVVRSISWISPFLLKFLLISF